MTPEGRFQPVAVQIGRSGGDTTEILSGLQGGERVVASGQFLIDSEASLSGALDRLNAGAPEGQTAEAMPDMDGAADADPQGEREVRSEENTSELQSLMRIPYDVVFLKKTRQR